MPSSLYVGLMSGTSVDAIDCALVRCDRSGIALLHTLEHPIPADVREAIARISQPGDSEIDRMGPLDRVLGDLFANATLALLEEAGHAADEVAAIGSHGQTIRHRPPSALAAGDPAHNAFTLQIGDPGTIAERTGITTVADFRRRDVAAGGEGAPLAPAFHAAAFSQPGTPRAIVNIGGIANITLLDGKGGVTGCDTGPGNTLLDHWVARHLGSPYDRDGQWSAEGQVSSELLDTLMGHAYLGRSGPRSTGKEAFNLAWLDRQLAGLDSTPDPKAVQATLAEFTAETIARGISESAIAVQQVYVCGGGARNGDLMRRLYQKLQPATLDTTAALGIEPEWVEAAAFGWLAWRSMAGLSGNVPSVTGASAPLVLGGIYPGQPPAAG